jgi:hypothetical protein
MAASAPALASSTAAPPSPMRAGFVALGGLAASAVSLGLAASSEHLPLPSLHAAVRAQIPCG